MFHLSVVPYMCLNKLLDMPVVCILSRHCWNLDISDVNVHVVVDERSPRSDTLTSCEEKDILALCGRCSIQFGCYGILLFIALYRRIKRSLASSPFILLQTTTHLQVVANN